MRYGYPETREDHTKGGLAFLGIHGHRKAHAVPHLTVLQIVELAVVEENKLIGRALFTQEHFFGLNPPIYLCGHDLVKKGAIMGGVCLGVAIDDTASSEKILEGRA
jgi:hypothetical protein